MCPEIAPRFTFCLMRMTALSAVVSVGLTLSAMAGERSANDTAPTDPYPAAKSLNEKPDTPTSAQPDNRAGGANSADDEEFDENTNPWGQGCPYQDKELELIG